MAAKSYEGLSINNALVILGNNKIICKSIQSFNIPIPSNPLRLVFAPLKIGSFEPLPPRPKLRSNTHPILTL